MQTNLYATSMPLRQQMQSELKGSDDTIFVHSDSLFSLAFARVFSDLENQS